MKILIATGLYPPEMGGPATYTTFLEHHLTGTRVSVSVLPFRTVRSLPKIFRHFVYTMKLVWKARGVDLFYALDTVSVGLPVLIASRITRTPYFLRIPGDYAWEQGSQRFGVSGTLDEYLESRKSAPWQVRVLARIQTWVATHACHVIVPSEYMRKVAEMWGVKKDKISRVYSELKVLEVPETRKMLRRELNLTTFTIVSAGRLVPWKGMATLIDAVCTLYKEGVPVQLLILGDGTCRPEIESQIATCHASEYVTLLGTHPRAEMARFLKAADVFVLNTGYEGLSHQLVEVLSLGTPILTTPVGGNRELITDRVTGTFFEWNDRAVLTALLRDVYKNPQTFIPRQDVVEETLLRFHEDTVIREFIQVVETYGRHCN